MWNKSSEVKPRIGENVIYTDTKCENPENTIYDPMNTSCWFLDPNQDKYWLYAKVNEKPWENIDWDNPEDLVTDHFTVHEVLYLPTWRKYHVPREEEKKNAYELCLKLELLRSGWGAFIVHSFIRPEKYNKEIGGVESSYHILGKGVDLHVGGYATPGGCDKMRKDFEPYLEKLELRMERGDGKARIHLDSGEVKYNRYFLP